MDPGAVRGTDRVGTSPPPITEAAVPRNPEQGGLPGGTSVKRGVCGVGAGAADGACSRTGRPQSAAGGSMADTPLVSWSAGGGPAARSWMRLLDVRGEPMAVRETIPTDGAEEHGGRFGASDGDRPFARSVLLKHVFHETGGGSERLGALAADFCHRSHLRSSAVGEDSGSSWPLRPGPIPGSGCWTCSI